jgi:hypothetical protein
MTESEPSAPVPTLGAAFWGLRLPRSKCQWPKGELSAMRKLDVERPGCHVLPGWILSTSPTWRASVDVVSSDTYDKDREKRDYARLILMRNMMRFRLVWTLSKSNNPTSTIAILYCGKIGYLRWIADFYLYSLKNCLIYMTSFSFCYNPNKHVLDWDFN